MGNEEIEMQFGYTKIPVTREKADRWLKFARSDDYREFVIEPCEAIIDEFKETTLTSGVPCKSETYLIACGACSVAGGLAGLPEPGNAIDEIVEEFRDSNSNGDTDQ